MSRKRAISPYAIIVALLYLKRLKTKISNTKYGKKCSYWPCYSAKNLIESYFNPMKNEFENFGNTELCVVSIVDNFFLFCYFFSINLNLAFGK